MRKIKIFDTTLRDGEQSPGASLTINEKVIIAKQLENLGVDIIEAGFPVASEGDFRAVSKIAEEVKNPAICALARTIEKDIERAGKALQMAEKSRIHVFIATSNLHLEKKLRKSKEEVKRVVERAIKLAKNYVRDVEFSLEDATRTDLDFMGEIAEIAVESGASTINIPDTVGYAQPEEFAERIHYLKKSSPSLNENIAISVHCHDDLGNALANSLAGIKAGATQVECTVNGLGERAGNAPLEEVVMNLETRKDFFGSVGTSIKTREIFKTSQLVSQLTGIEVQRNKALVGRNAFAHQAGIHQHGILKSRETYEIISPEQVGWVGEALVIGKHSGRHAVKKVVDEFGFNLTSEEVKLITQKVKELADKQKVIFRDDIAAIASEIATKSSGRESKIKLKELEVTTGNKIIPQAKIILMVNGRRRVGKGKGIGSVDALSNAIGKITPTPQFKDYQLRAVTSGSNALADVTLTLTEGEREFTSKGIDEDIVIASAKAIIDGVNKTLNFRNDRKKKENERERSHY